MLHHGILCLVKGFGKTGFPELTFAEFDLYYEIHVLASDAAKARKILAPLAGKQWMQTGV